LPQGGFLYSMEASMAGRRVTLSAAQLAELGKSGDAETLREYWARQAHPGPTRFEFADEIAWGTDGDFDRCTRLVMEHGRMTEEQAHGYCNLEHHRALGYWPAQHARMEREGQ
jgi:hypothetical protein